MTTTERSHGGPDFAGPVRWDFSTNANSLGPCPAVLELVQRADPTRYPDADYLALRKRLADHHQVSPDRILLAASASEFIQRITAVSARLEPGAVELPEHAYGDYAVAARACSRSIIQRASGRDTIPTASLRWYADPSSPLGQTQAPSDSLGARLTVVDRVYAPLRLYGSDPWSRSCLDRVFELHSPNKALGLTGVRGAYAIAPADDSARMQAMCAALRAAEPSWPLGAHAVAMLTAWTESEVQRWLRESLDVLRERTASLRQALDGLGLNPLPSDAPFLCAKRPLAARAAWLRARGLAVRDAASFGLAGLMRLSAQSPEATNALIDALREALQESDQEPSID